jgi:murein DD-endopeptidase MepM/ murein hydrolase activator NlpD
MAQLPRRLAPDLIALAAALQVGIASAVSAAQVDLEGTWHVLVHYRDASAANAETERWEDRLWVFEPSGDRLRWKEYPIVVFDDETGRFERRAGSGQYARVLHAWEPSPGQLVNLRAGLAANDRGSQTKSLRRRGDAWSSESRANATGSSVVTYQESWSIGDPDGLPVFEQVDVLGSESAESAEGRTVLRTEQVLEEGALLVGSYDRDGTRRGTFQMRRSGERRELAKKTQSELQRQAFSRGEEFRRNLGVGSAPAGARHDESTRYRFPFEPDVARRLILGVGGEMATGVMGPTSNITGHRDPWRYGFDFEIPRGEPILVARDGEVILVGANFVEFASASHDGPPPPSVQIHVLHADGTFAVYGHLEEVSVEEGMRVQVGSPLGIAKGPKVHFSVLRNAGGGNFESLPIRFDDGTPEGVVPIAGQAYGGKRP